VTDYSPHDADDTGAMAGEYPPALPPEPFPWPPAEGDSVISAFARTWHGASLAPSSFFARMPAAGSTGAAILYYMAIGIAVAGAELFWSMIRGAVAQPREVTAGAVDSALALSPLLGFLLSPLMLLGSLLLSAAVIHGMLRLLGGARHDFAYTLRLLCFAYSPQIVGVFPYLGLFGFVWMIVVAIKGVKAGHGTTTGRAATAVLVPVTVALAFVGVFLLMARAAGLLELPI
jgi:hypothetical protein